MSDLLNVLVIDDNPIDREVYKRLLTKSQKTLSFNILEASNCTEGLSFYLENPIDCILLDYNLPDMTGLDFLEQLNKNEALPIGTPIIMLTGQGNENIAVEAMKRGLYDYLIKSDLSSEKLVRTIQSGMDTFRLKKQIDMQSKMLKHMAHHDPLTDLLNRSAFEENLIRMFAHAKRHNRKFALLLIDLDNFKGINDVYGHITGDLLLKEVASRLKNKLRRDDILARIGGDEFAVLLNEIHHPYDAGKAAKKLIENINGINFLNGNKVCMSASIGIAYYPPLNPTVNIATLELEEFIKWADRALYRAKDLGRNRYQFFINEINQQYFEHLTLEASLQDALAQQQFHLVYQPWFDITTGKMLGVETLVRWDHPEQGTIMPLKFLSIAEESDIIYDIEQWIFTEAFKQYVKWQKKHPPYYFSLNVSAKQLVSVRIIETLKSIIDKTKIPPEQIILEIDDTALANLMAKMALPILGDLANLGIKLSLDNVSLKTISLSFFNQFPIHSIKLAPSFLKEMSTDETKEALAKSFLAFAKSVNVQVIAKGVENEEQLMKLKNCGCSKAQGFYFSNVLTAEEFQKMWQNGVFKV